MVNLALIGIGLAAIIAAGLLYYVIGVDVFNPTHNEDAHKWGIIYVLTTGFVGLGIFIVGFFMPKR